MAILSLFENEHTEVTQRRPNEDDDDVADISEPNNVDCVLLSGQNHPEYFIHAGEREKMKPF